MPSNYTISNRFTLQASGENNNTWGVKLNDEVFKMVDESLDGWTIKALTGDVTLASANGVTDEARKRVLKFSGSVACTVTCPSVTKWYFVWNASTQSQIITTGAGTSATIGAGEVTAVICDGTNVKQLGVGGVSFRSYADTLAFEALAGDLPGQTDKSGKALTTDGTTASWGDLPQSTITNLTTDLATLTSTDTTNLAEAKAFAIAMAVTFGV